MILSSIKSRAPTKAHGYSVLWLLKEEKSMGRSKCYAECCIDANFAFKILSINLLRHIRHVYFEVHFWFAKANPFFPAPWWELSKVFEKRVHACNDWRRYSWDLSPNWSFSDRKKVRNSIVSLSACGSEWAASRAKRSFGSIGSESRQTRVPSA